MRLYLPIVLLLTLYVSSLSQDVKIYPENDPDSRTVDFGLRYFENDEVIRSFVIENNTLDTLYTGDKLPTNGTFEFQNGDFRHIHFEPVEQGISAIPPGGTLIRSVKFFANDQATDILGLMQARFALGVSSNSSANTVLDTLEFVLEGYSTDKKIDTWRKNIRFDSVYVGSTLGNKKDMIIRNNWTEKLEVKEANFTLITSEINGKEYFVQELSYPLSLQARTNPGEGNEKIEISYRPQDAGADTAIVELVTIPEPNSPGFLEYVSSTISGVGVEQKIEIIQANYPTSFRNGKYEVDLGRIRSGQEINFNATLVNAGNFEPIFINQESDLTEFELIDSLKNSYQVLELNESDEINCTFIINDKGEFEKRLSFESDLLDRNVKGVTSNEVAKFEVIFKGVTTKPLLVLSEDTLNFESVSLSETCPNTVYKEILIRNSGDETLLVDFIPEDLSVFNITIATDDRSIDPDEVSSATISFNPQDVREYNSRIRIETNSIDEDSLKFLFLEGIGVEPIAVNLSNKPQSFFPGNVIEIPILCDGSKLGVSDRFSAEISYNPSMLDFESINTIGTASEGSDNISSIVEDADKGIINLQLNMPDPLFFYEKDTLLLLRFNTFLGNAESTILSFQTPKFGSNTCDELLPVFIEPNLISIDSLCGLTEKINSTRNLSVSLPYPNPSSEIVRVNIYSKEKRDLEVILLNDAGEIVSSKNISVEQLLEYKINTAPLSSGLYILIIDDGKERRSVKLTIRK